jgi:hypothetical protein
MLTTDQSTARNAIVSHMAGILFSMGWWFWVDGLVLFPSTIFGTRYPFLYIVPGITSTIAFIVMAILPWQTLFSDEEGFWGEGTSRSTYRLWMFIALLCLFGSFLGSILIYVLGFMPLYQQHPQDVSKYAGVTIILQNVLIPLAALLFRFGRSSGSDDFEAF